MSAVERARMLYYENSGYSFSNLKVFDVNQALRIRSLQYLEQVTNLCQKIRLTPYTYHDEPLDIKLKFLQAYQYSILYSTNLKNMCDQKQLQLDTQNKTLKQQIQNKRNAIKQHKRKVQKRKHQYRDLKLQKAKLVCKHFQKEMDVNFFISKQLKNKHNELNEIKTKLQQEIQFGRNHILEQKYHPYQHYQPQPTIPLNNYFPSNYEPSKIIQNHQIPSPQGQRPSINQMLYSKQKSSSNRQSEGPSHSQIIFDEENRIEEIEAKKSTKKNSILSSKGQKLSVRIIGQSDKTKAQSKNMIESKVDIKFVQTIIGEKDDQFLNESLKPLSIVSMEKSKSNVSKKSDEINKTNVINSPTSKIRITEKDDLEEEKDKVKELYDFGLEPQSKIDKNHIKNKSSLNSQISKGESSSFIDPDDSFYNKKIVMDSNISRNDLMNSNSGITAKQSGSIGNLFNQSKIKRKGHEDEVNKKSREEDNYLSLATEQSVRLSKNDDLPDKNLWMSKNGVNQQDENVQNLFNAPKKKSSSTINVSYSSMKDNQSDKAFESPRRSDNFNDINDLDDLELGFTTVESKVQKKGKEQNKLNLKVTTSKLDDVAEESESEITTKQNTKIIVPPAIPKTEDESEYEDDFENQNQNKSHVNLEVDDSKEEQPVTNNKSQVQINVSPNNSFTDVIKEDEKLFPDLNSGKFQLKKEHQSYNENQPQGIFVSYQNQTQILASNDMKNSNQTENHDKNGQQVTVSNDFMDDFFIPEQSSIGKRPAGLKKTSRLTPEKDIKASYNINVLNNQKQVTFKKSIKESITEEDDLLLELQSGLLLSNKPIQNNKTKKPQTMNLIQSTTFDDVNTDSKPGNLHYSINESVNLPQIKTSVLQSKDNRTESMNLLKLNNPVLQSRQNDKIDEEDEVQEDIDFDLEEDNSKLIQSQKQQIQRKLVKIMRNKHKPSEKPNYNPKAIDKNIQIEIQNLLNIDISKSKETDWKMIRKNFDTKIKEITKEHKGNTKNIETKLTQIEQRNKKLLDKEKIEKDKVMLDKIKQESQDQNSDLIYSQSIIKDSFQKSSLTKKNLKLETDSDMKNSSVNKMTNSSIIGDDTMTLSLKEKSMIGQKNLSQLPEILQNNSFEADSIYNKSNLNETLEFGIPQLKEESKFIKRNDQPEGIIRSNKLIAEKNQQRPNEASKSKYIKSVTPTAKGVSRQNSVSRLQENKYVSIEDPLNNQINNNKLGNITFDKDNDEDDF